MKRTAAAGAALSTALVLSGCGAGGGEPLTGATRVAETSGVGTPEPAGAVEDGTPAADPGGGGYAAAAPEPAPAPSPAPSPGPVPAQVTVTVTVTPRPPARAKAATKTQLATGRRVTTHLVARDVPRMGGVVTDQQGSIFYRFDKDRAKPPTSTCTGRCATTWPPVLVTDTPRLTGLDPDTVGTLRRDDGGLQVTLGGWPVYRYAGDTVPGTWKGQGLGRTWFVVTRTGAKNLTCLPRSGTAAATSAAPTTATPAGDGGY